MGQFHEFLEFNFWRVFDVWPNCELRRAVLVCIERETCSMERTYYVRRRLQSVSTPPLLLPAMRCTAYMIKSGFARNRSKIKQFSSG